MARSQVCAATCNALMHLWTVSYVSVRALYAEFGRVATWTRRVAPAVNIAFGGVCDERFYEGFIKRLTWSMFSGK